MTLRQNQPPHRDTRTLKDAIDRGGFYPSLVHHTLREALDERESTHHIVHVDTHFDMEEVHRHITVLALAQDVIVVAHLDDHADDDEDDLSRLHTEDATEASRDVVARISTEVVPVSRIRTLILSEVHREPDRFSPDRRLAEVSLNLNWTGGARFEMIPSDCGNPECMVDHGESGSFVPEDIVLRIAATAEGDDAVAEARSFVRALRRACVKYAR